jgi:hypothetical protein
MLLGSEPKDLDSADWQAATSLAKPRATAMDASIRDDGIWFEAGADFIYGVKYPIIRQLMSREPVIEDIHVSY